MTEPRIGNTKEAARRLGFIKRDGRPHCVSFLAWARQNNIKPVHGTEHHFWWDLKAIDQLLDKNSGIKSKSSDWSSVFKQRMAKRGGVQGEIPAH